MIALVILIAAWFPVGYFATAGFDAHLATLAVPPAVASVAAALLWQGAGATATIGTIVLLYSLTRGRMRAAAFRWCGAILALEYVWLFAGVAFTVSISGALG